MMYNFPYPTVRSHQKEFMDAVHDIVSKGSQILIHAPTGLGKTICSLSPSIYYAKKNGKKVLFLTSKNTQHELARQTVYDINEASMESIKVVDITAKQGLCLQPNVDQLKSNEFHVFCKKLRDSEQCSFYSNTRTQEGLTTQAQALSYDIFSPAHAKLGGEQHHMCPYELLIESAKHADVIIADYYYVFHPKIRSSFFYKIGLELEDCIVIVDEAHNLPSRVKNLASSQLSTFTLRLARSEAVTFGLTEIVEIIDYLNPFIEGWNNSPIAEKQISKEWLCSILEDKKPFSEIVELFDSGAQSVYEVQQRSVLASIVEFFEAWNVDDERYARIVAKTPMRNKPEVSILFQCLDPRTFCSDVFTLAHASIVMSGTMQPLHFYKDVLGLTGETVSFDSPFPPENKLELIIPSISTKYSERTSKTVDTMVSICHSLSGVIPGNILIFAPSYTLAQELHFLLQQDFGKPVLVESQGAVHADRVALLERFKSYSKTGAILIAVAGGSFGEGVDLPGNLVQGVIIVGLPISRPTLESQLVVKYYDKLFGNGWDYAFTYPALNIALQNAGRCIRSPTDKGVVVFLDKRYVWPRYRASLSQNAIVTEEFESFVTSFYTKSTKSN